MSDDDFTPKPIKVQVVRWRCPFCGRGHSGRTRAVEHMGRCWLNPEARSCKTCLNFQPALSADCGVAGCSSCGNPEFCHEGLPVGIPSENRPDRLKFPINCPKWQFDDQARAW